MSIPFSNTNLRVPRGFGNILEGLAREVLRNQPQDIPTFAALYFNGLLKDREDSGQDPAEWGAKLEDRFYNNHAFKEKEKDAESSPTSEQSVGRVHENSSAETLGCSESEFIQPAHISAVSTANPGVFDEVPGVESWGSGGAGGEGSEDIDSAELDPSHPDPYGGIATADTLGCSESELIQPAHISTVSTANPGVFDEVPGVESWGGGGTGGEGSEDIGSAELDPSHPDPYGGIATAETLGCSESEFIQPVHISTVSTANPGVFDEVPGVDSWGGGGTGGEDICSAKLDPSCPDPYGSVANVDVCAEGSRVPVGGGASVEPWSEGEMDLGAALGSPAPQGEWSELPVPRAMEEIPAGQSVGSPQLDFGDYEVGQTQDAGANSTSEKTLQKVDIAEHTQGEADKRVEMVAEDGEGKEEKMIDLDVGPVQPSASPSEQHLGDGNKSGTEPQTRGQEVLHIDSDVKDKEEVPLLGTGLDSAGEEDPPLGTALGSGEESSTEEANDPESIQPQQPCTGEATEKTAIATAEGINEDTSPQDSARMKRTLDDDNENEEDDDKNDEHDREEMKKDNEVTDTESEKIIVDVQAMEDVSSTAKEQGIEESKEQKQYMELEKQEQGTEEQEQAMESEKQEQGTEDQERDMESEKQKKGTEEQGQAMESEKQEQGTEDQERDMESEKQKKGTEEQGQAMESEKQKQGIENQEQATESKKQEQDAEEQDHDMEPERQEQGTEDQECDMESERQEQDAKEQEHDMESEKQEQGTEEQEQAMESEKQEQDAEDQEHDMESEKQEQDAEVQEQCMESEEQRGVLSPKMDMDKREPKDETEAPLQNPDERNDSLEREVAQQEEAKEVVPVEGQGQHEEECSQPQEEEDVMDIPLDDPEANKAAAKIQAGFRGHMTRKKMKDDKPQEVSSSGDTLNGSQRDSEPARSEGLEGDDTSAPEQ